MFKQQKKCLHMEYERQPREKEKQPKHLELVDLGEAKELLA